MQAAHRAKFPAPLHTIRGGIVIPRAYVLGQTPDFRNFILHIEEFQVGSRCDAINARCILYLQLLALLIRDSFAGLTGSGELPAHVGRVVVCCCSLWAASAATSSATPSKSWQVRSLLNRPSPRNPIAIPRLHSLIRLTFADGDIRRAMHVLRTYAHCFPVHAREVLFSRHRMQAGRVACAGRCRK